MNRIPVGGFAFAALAVVLLEAVRAQPAGPAASAWGLGTLVLVAIAAAHEARGRVDARHRRAWGWFVAAFGVWFAAFLAWHFAPSKGDAAAIALIALLFYPAVLVGFTMAAPATPPRPLSASLVLDRALLFSATMTVFLAVTARHPVAGDQLPIAFLLGFRPLATALATLTLSVIGARYLAEEGPDEPGLAAAIGAIAFVAAGDLLLELVDGWRRWADAWWAVGAFAFTLAALRAGPAAPSPAEPRRRAAPSPIPFVATGVLLITLIADAIASRERGTNVLAIGAALTVALVLVRQWLALRENATLARARIEAEQGRLEADRRRRESERLDALGRMAQGVAHDFNSLLTGIIQNAELALEDLHEPALAAESLRHVKQSAVTAGVITRHLLAFARTGAVTLQPVDVRAAIARHVDALRAGIPERVRLEVRLCDGPLLVRTAVGFSEQVLGNLVRNAAEAMPDGGTLTVILEADPETVALTIRDTGQGMDEATRARIFEPFFSTKGVRGTGLGLPTAWGLVRQCGGDIGVETAPGRGTTFRVSWPRVVE